MRFTQKMEAEVKAAILQNPEACITFDRKMYRPDGQILIHRDGTAVFLHRYLYREVMHEGDLPRGKFLLQICKTPGCMNPTPKHRQVYDRARWRTEGNACPNGHERTPENTRIDSRGYRECITCATNQAAKQRTGKPDSPQLQAAKTHCPNGHEYTKENIYWGGPNKTWRKCRICTKMRAAGLDPAEMTVADATVKHA